MTEPLRIGPQIKVLSNLLMREIGNHACVKSADEATGNKRKISKRKDPFADVRHYFDKFGGNLGASNSVLWQFKEAGVLIVDKEDVDEDELMMCALDNGADDFDGEGEAFEILTAPSAFSAVRVALEEAGYEFLTAEVTRIADNDVSLTDEKERFKMQLLLDALEDDDDVQKVAHNWAE